MNDWEAGTSRLATEDFDVFLNHRGPDVKSTFVAHLEDALRGAGFRPFLDARSLMKGNPALQSIDQALDMAKVHIAVVSTGYAQSKYCLNELVAIVRSGKPVIPVFYGVEPADLRRVEEGPFAEAFEGHTSKERSEKKVPEWREALAALAGITGFHLAAYRSDESKLKRDVVSQVARLNPSHIPVEVDSCRVGLECPARSCIHILEQMGDAIGILGLVGMGGIGKTTLAREIFNYYAARTKFRHMSFLEIHRENNHASSSSVQVRPTWSRELRKQLLWDLLHVETSGSTDYKNWFRKVSTLGPVMIVVDDVHNLEQFNALIPFAAGLHPGSRIMVTSRDRSVLNNVAGRAGVDHFIFDIALLDSHDSNMLFNWHAFQAKEVPEDFQDLAKDIVAACGGLPLALKVIGSSLFDKRSRGDRETIWVEAGDAMRQSMDVMDVLRWSYNILSRTEQRMFVDITCLFNNEDVEEALSFWSSCKECGSCAGVVAPHTSLQNLIDKNLVSCVGNRKFEVHDLLVELGKEIGRVAKTHIVNGKNGGVAFLTKKGSSKTVAMNLREGRKRKFEVEDFANMHNLHFLELPEGGIVNGDWRCSSKELRWLRWRNTSLTHVPPDLDLSQLVSLDFSKSSTLVALWSNLNCSLKGCPNLVRLNLSECTSITKLPESIGQSSQLQILNLQGCTRLKKLPESVGQLKQLQDLQLNECKRLKALPDSIGQASRLERLGLEECMMLESLPDSIGLLKKISCLDMTSCLALKTLPDSLSDMSSLEYLYTEVCTSMTTLPHSIQLCSNLQHLTLRAITDSEIFSAGSIGKAWTKLRSLQLLNSHGLASLLDYGAFKSLSTLIVEDKSLTEVPESIGLLPTLWILEISCQKVQCLPNSLGDLTRLRELYLTHCENLKRLPKTLSALMNLKSLSIKDCGLLRKLPSSIGLLSKLRNLNIYKCKKMQKLPTTFTQLINLRTFVFIKCGSSEAMGMLTTLQSMPIWGSTSLTTLPPSLGVLSNFHIQGENCEYDFQHRHYLWPCVGEDSLDPFDRTCQVLEDDENGFLKAHHSKSTGLLTLERRVYYKEEQSKEE